MADEIEVKLGAWPGFEVPPLDGTFGGLRAEPDNEHTLDAIYHDAADLRLVRAGITLRHRTGEGGEDGAWTLKLPGSTDGHDGAIVRDELVVPGPPSAVPAELRVLLRPWLRTATLVPIAHLQTLRRASTLWVDPVPEAAPEPVSEPSDVDGRPLFGPPEPGTETEVEPLADVDFAAVPEPEVAEAPLAEPAEPKRVGIIDDDEVSVIADGRVAARFREVEVEVLADAPDGLLAAVVDRLRLAGAGAPDPTPKLVRALGPRALQPADLDTGEIARDAAAAAVLRAGIARAVERIVEHDRVIRADVDPEGIHQARVGTRRLRSDLRTFASLLDTNWSQPLRDELKWLAGELGEVRDRDVLAARLRTRIAKLSDDDREAVEGIVAKLDRERKRAVAKAVAALDSRRYLALLDRLVDASHQPRTLPDADAPAREVLPALAGAAFQKLHKGVKKAGKDPTDEELHALRIKAKRARYAADVAVPVVGDEAKAYTKAVGALQDVLGDLHDCAVAAEWLRAALPRATRAQSFALGLLVAGQGHEADELRSRWRSAWDDVNRSKLTRWLQ